VKVALDSLSFLALGGVPGGSTSSAFRLPFPFSARRGGFKTDDDAIPSFGSDCLVRSGVGAIGDASGVGAVNDSDGGMRSELFCSLSLPLDSMNEEEEEEGESENCR